MGQKLLTKFTPETHITPSGYEKAREDWNSKIAGFFLAK
jgi:hypothetical protein